MVEGLQSERRGQSLSKVRKLDKEKSTEPCLLVSEGNTHWVKVNMISYIYTSRGEGLVREHGSCFLRLASPFSASLFAKKIEKK